MNSSIAYKLVAMLCIATIISLLGCKEDRTISGFNLSAESMPGDLFYYHPVISQVSGSTYFITKERLRTDRKEDGHAVIQVEPGKNLTLEMHHDAAPENSVPVCYLPDHKFIAKQSHTIANSKHYYSLVKIVEDEISETLVEDMRKYSNRPAMPRMTYSPENGLTMFFYHKPDQFTVYQDFDVTAGGETINDVAAVGSGFVGEQLVWVLVTGDGIVHSYFADISDDQQLPQLQWLGATWIGYRQSVHASNATSFVFADGITATSSKDEVVLLSSTGNQFRVTKHKVSREDLHGRKRSSEDGQQSIDDGLYYKDEGRSAGPGLVGSACVLMPCDQHRIAIFDRDYQRLIIAEKEADTE